MIGDILGYKFSFLVEVMSSVGQKIWCSEQIFRSDGIISNVFKVVNNEIE